MKQYSKGILAIVVLSGMAILTAINTNAQTITTDPVGYITQSVTNGLNLVSLGMTQLPVARGVIGQINTRSLTDLNQNFAPGAGTNYIIEITSGSAIGIMDDITNTIAGPYYTSSTNYYSMISSGNTYKVYPVWTLDTAFGPPSQSGINGSNNLGNADNVLLYTPGSGYATYWYRTTTTTQGWKDSGSNPAGSTKLYIDEGLAIQRKLASAASYKLVGGVKLGQTVQPGTNGLNFCGNPYAGGFTLDSLQLYTGNVATGVRGSNNLANADNVLIYTPGSGYATYWYRTTTTTQGWKDSGSNPAGSTSVPLGTVLVIQRKYNAIFNWSMPAPY